MLTYFGGLELDRIQSLLQAKAHVIEQDLVYQDSTFQEHEAGHKLTFKACRIWFEGDCGIVV